jgi:dihydrofolate synthase/folylpolyglutamate synthase
MTYAQLLERLVQARRFGMKLGLSRMRELLDRLGAPDRRLGTVVHVGGTNGKGSTVAMVAALARSAGARVATYTSPHLSTLRERVTIDGELVGEAELVEAAARVDAAGGTELTFFEQVTAIAMSIIAARGVDVTVLEVGLGGRLDATNVVAAPIAAVTGVALDHEAILGPTVAAIAYEKAGIFKRGQRAFIGAAGEPEAVPLLAQHARAAGVAELQVIDAPARLPLALAGPHQQDNAALALALVDALGLPADPAALTALSHPGRFEVAGDLILDGAHNPHGARALARTLRERQLRPVLVAAVSADKDVRAIADALVPEVRAVIATRYQQERALSPDDLAATFRAASEQLPGATPLPIESAPDLQAAVARARSLGTPVLVAGSLFLVGEARSRFLGAPTDPVFVSDPARRGPSA